MAMRTRKKFGLQHAAKTFTLRTSDASLLPSQAASKDGLNGIRELHQKLRLRCADCGLAVASADSGEQQPTVKLSACSRCRMVFYCCAEHQKRDWKAVHKAACPLLAGVVCTRRPSSRSCSAALHLIKP